MDEFLLGYIHAKIEDIDETTEKCVSLIHSKPSKMNKWLENHKIIGKALPYVIGFGLGILPFIIYILILYNV